MVFTTRGSVAAERSAGANTAARSSRRTPSWMWAAAGLAPVALLVAALLGSSRQVVAYSAVHNTISMLSARGATDRWIMTAGLAVLGACYTVIAIGLVGANALGRWLLALGGVATMLVAASPQPSAGHVPAAGTAFVALALWPILSGLPNRVVSASVTILLVVLLVWFGVELGGSWIGLTERFLAGAQALWPLMLLLLLPHYISGDDRSSNIEAPANLPSARPS